MRWQRNFENLSFNELLYLVRTVHVVFIHQCKRNAGCISAGGAAGTVNVILGVIRDIVIDNQVDILNVNPAAHYVSGNQNPGAFRPITL